MKKQIETILNIKIYNIHIFYCISLIYVLMQIADNYNLHELYKFFKSPFFVYNLMDFFIYSLVFIFFICLPEVIIYTFDFAVKKFAIENKRIVKIIKILLIILSYIYFVLLCLLFISARGLFEEL